MMSGVGLMLAGVSWDISRCFKQEKRITLVSMVSR